MQALKLEDAIREVATIGFGGFELCAISKWDSAPENMSPDRRESVRSLLSGSQLRLVAIIEDLPPRADDAEHAQGLERLKAAITLGRDISPQKRALVQTVLGGGKWDEVKGLFRDRIGDWSKLAEELDTVICIKPHRFGAMSTPAQAAWIIEQLGNTPRIRIVYDYSHYAFRDLSIDETVQQGQQLIAYVAMKDAVQSGNQISFSLPGEAKNDRSRGHRSYAENFGIPRRLLLRSQRTGLFQAGVRSHSRCADLLRKHESRVQNIEHGFRRSASRRGHDRRLSHGD